MPKRHSRKEKSISSLWKSFYKRVKRKNKGRYTAFDRANEKAKRLGY